MVFSFMLLMTTGERQPSLPGQTGPQQTGEAGRSRLAVVPPEQIARLSKADGRLWLRFDHDAYDPVREMDRIEKDQRIALITGADGREQRVLYLEDDRSNQVLLAEYLEAFQHLNRRGIGVAFAERIK